MLSNAPGMRKAGSITCLFRAAAGGVIFLDEVADMPMPMQAKLLRVLEEQEVVPLGDTFPRKVDVRVLSATNRDLRPRSLAAGSAKICITAWPCFPYQCRRCAEGARIFHCWPSAF